jgi:hypothetical protein
LFVGIADLQLVKATILAGVSLFDWVKPEMDKQRQLLTALP